MESRVKAIIYTTHHALFPLILQPNKKRLSPLFYASCRCVFSHCLYFCAISSKLFLFVAIVFFPLTIFISAPSCTLFAYGFTFWSRAILCLPMRMISPMEAVMFFNSASALNFLPVASWTNSLNVCAEPSAHTRAISAPTFGLSTMYPYFL